MTFLVCRSGKWSVEALCYSDDTLYSGPNRQNQKEYKGLFGLAAEIDKRSSMLEYNSVSDSIPDFPCGFTAIVLSMFGYGPKVVEV